ncbi:unnamed protein product [Chrysodeixis includens]|uniref:Uncharacterized protein n=1 Tax=Chrysodeixis includens TaxID=689277 RepID=A0A9P0BZX4_CHRIL|nr:unnamed protein product [Chrysodeixis includens]
MSAPWSSFILLAVLIVVEAKPRCVTYGSEVVCNAGTTDYKLERGLVSDDTRTSSIILKSCRITDVEYESFNSLTALKHLDLSQNKIQKLKLGVIDEPKQLTHLNLSHNQITAFPLGLFDQVTRLTHLDLKGNKISNLELGIFDPLHGLKVLDLSSNNLLGRDLNPYVFDQSTHITWLDYSRNDMSDAPQNLLHALDSLEFLNLDRCFLTEVPAFAIKSNLRTMKHLILSTNQIKSLDNAAIFVNLDNLEILDLSYNLLENINGDILAPLKKLQKIVLRSNKIKTIPDNLFRNIPKLITIDLFGNLMEDVPVNAFRGSPLKNLNLANNKITYLQDNFCLELMNSGGKLKKFLFDPNPWQCACLMDLLKEVKKFGIEYNSAKYNGKEPVCVTWNEFRCNRQQIVNEDYIDAYHEAKSTKKILWSNHGT